MLRFSCNFVFMFQLMSFFKISNRINALSSVLWVNSLGKCLLKWWQIYIWVCPRLAPPCIFLKLILFSTFAFIVCILFHLYSAHHLQNRWLCFDCTLKLSQNFIAQLKMINVIKVDNSKKVQIFKCDLRCKWLKPFGKYHLVFLIFDVLIVLILVYLCCIYHLKLNTSLFVCLYGESKTTPMQSCPSRERER